MRLWAVLRNTSVHELVSGSAKHYCTWTGVFDGLQDVIARKILRTISSNSTTTTSINNQTAHTHHIHMSSANPTSNLTLNTIHIYHYPAPSNWKFVLSSLLSHDVISNNKYAAIYTYKPSTHDIRSENHSIYYQTKLIKWTTTNLLMS